MEPINDNTRKWLSWAIVVMLIVISTVMGVQFPIPQPPIESLGYTHFSGLVITEPTTVATATPGAVINSLGLGNILEVQDASTPVFTINNGGNRVAAGGQTNNNWIKVSAPTAIATATPAAVIDSLGLSNILEVRDAATPVFAVRNGGTLLGTLQYATAGQKIICSSTTITGTGTLPTTLSTPSYIQLSLAEDVTGDCVHLSYTNSAATVTAKCWNSALTPAAATTPVAVNWCAIGTP
jgi:hypothetical protein